MSQSGIKVLLFILVCFHTAFSQGDDSDDFQTWNSIGLNYEHNENWRFGLEEQLRLKENSSVIDAYFTELYTRYNYNKDLYTAVAFRFYRENDNQGRIQGYENHIRLHADLGYKYEVDRFELESRLRVQRKDELGRSREQGDEPINKVRLKIGVTYNIKKWKLDPEISSEIFRDYESGEQSRFDKYRITIGTKYKIKRFGKIGLYYRMERDVNTSNPATVSIIGLQYSYTIKR